MPILHEPAISLEGAKIRSLSLANLGLNVTIRVENKNPVGVTLKEIPFIVLINDGGRQQEIANGNTGNVAIPAQSCTQLAVPVTMRNEAIIGAMGGLVANGRIGVTIKGAAVVDAVITTWSVPFEKTVAVTMEEVAGALNVKYNERNDEQGGSGS
jgi:LEA14-like dessication related protein